MRPVPAPPPPDLALGLGLAGWWLLEVGDSSAVGVVSLAAMTVPLGWRRAAPLTAMCLVAAGFATAGLEADPPEPLAQLVATLVACFSVASGAATTRRAVAGLAAGLAGGVGEGLLVGQDVGFIIILTIAAWGAGAALRRLRRRSDALEARAATLDAQVHTAAAQERERIAREMHDVISHSVSLMVVQAGAAEQVLRRDADQAAQALAAIQATGRAAVDDLRRMLGLLRGEPAAGHPRAPQPGLATLGELVGAHGTPVALEQVPHPPLPAGVELAAYRIVQEALTNARRHAPGRPAAVRVGWADGRLDLEVRNMVANGHGAPAGPPGSGHGLVGMRERVALYGGTLEAGFDGRAEWVVHATLPVEPA
jgi:signal transduction histidine kinase